MRAQSRSRAGCGRAWWIKTTGFAAALAFLALWVSSGWWRWTWHVGWIGDGTLVGLGEGTVAVMRLDTRIIVAQGMSVDAFLRGLPLHAWDGWRPFHLELWFSFVDSTAGMRWHIAIPLWMFVVAALGLGIAGWRFDATARQRARTGSCASCGYDRSGIGATAACPECGKLPD